MHILWVYYWIKNKKKKQIKDSIENNFYDGIKLTNKYSVSFIITFELYFLKWNMFSNFVLIEILVGKFITLTMNCMVKCLLQ